MIAHPTTTRAAIARLRQHIAAAEHCADVASHGQNDFAVRSHLRRIANYQDQLFRLQRVLQKYHLRKRA